ncbi:MAG: aminopeptidase P family protein [Dysgonamonadaceae bacterium]|jgi:Xaa-Pro aminopeptidase|nr:aminopeptidase P family protein [Dysgonamonadaceae bacterium]
MTTITQHPIINDRIHKLRSAMQTKGLQACIIPSSDAHQGEYVPEHWKTREYFTGFTGSAGTLVVTQQDACLWTDSRYFLQAEQELNGTAITLQKEKLPDTPTIEQWLCDCLPPNGVAGIDATVFSIKDVEALQGKLQSAGLALCTDFDPAAGTWTNRPPLPESPVFVLPEAFSGETAGNKIHQLREKLKQEACNAILLCALDEIAWLFNIRGNDIPCNPVALAFALVMPEAAIVFIDPRKINDEVSAHFHQYNILTAAYDALPDYLATCRETLKIRLDAEKTAYHLYDIIRKLTGNGAPVDYVLQTGPSPVAVLKSIKNRTEIAGIRTAAEKDGLALVQLLMWIEKSLHDGTPVSETDVETKIKTLRSKQPLYFGESFDAIVGYGAHAAIVHYHASSASAEQLRAGSLLLVDTGAQYFDGTTDITRTIALGPPTAAMKHDFTLVLKGHIAIATARFPQGTRGAQLDVLARSYLWHEGLTYLHGTGHGIGHFLNVHEGPQNIRIEENPTPLQPGMILSNEPGLYRAGAYGIRIENMLLVKEDMETEFGLFYGFETLTLCPIDARLIRKEILSEAEKAWLNHYHQTIYQRLSPLLSNEERQWLKEKTNEI